MKMKIQKSDVPHLLGIFKSGLHQAIAVNYANYDFSDLSALEPFFKGRSLVEYLRAECTDDPTLTIYRLILLGATVSVDERAEWEDRFRAHAKYYTHPAFRQQPSDVTTPDVAAASTGSPVKRAKDEMSYVEAEASDTDDEFTLAPAPGASAVEASTDLQVGNVVDVKFANPDKWFRGYILSISETRINVFYPADNESLYHRRASLPVRFVADRPSSDTVVYDKNAQRNVLIPADASQPVKPLVRIRGVASFASHAKPVTPPMQPLPPAPPTPPALSAPHAPVAATSNGDAAAVKRGRPDSAASSSSSASAIAAPLLFAAAAAAAAQARAPTVQDDARARLLAAQQQAAAKKAEIAARLAAMQAEQAKMLQEQQAVEAQAQTSAQELEALDKAAVCATIEKRTAALKPRLEAALAELTAAVDLLQQVNIINYPQYLQSFVVQQAQQQMIQTGCYELLAKLGTQQVRVAGMAPSFGQGLIVALQKQAPAVVASSSSSAATVPAAAAASSSSSSAAAVAASPPAPAELARANGTLLPRPRF